MPKARSAAFAEKLEDIVGLYLDPPEHALVLCADEKSQIQALDRTQPGLPLKRGRGATITHDYKRNGTATLFAALNAANGEVSALAPAWRTIVRMARGSTKSQVQHGKRIPGLLETHDCSAIDLRILLVSAKVHSRSNHGATLFGGKER